MIDLLTKESAELQFRLLSAESDTRSTGSYSVIDQPPPPVSSSGRQSGNLLQPYRCECTRREGHHSSYACRRRRQWGRGGLPDQASLSARMTFRWKLLSWHPCIWYNYPRPPGFRFCKAWVGVQWSTIHRMATYSEWRYCTVNGCHSCSA